jgi:sulfur-oxidizing protein SoxY
LAVALPRAAHAEDARLEDAIRAVTGGAAPARRGVKVELPELAENGFSVPIVVEVEGTMTAERHVEAIHLLSERNPVTRIAEFRLGRRAGRARIASNVRLAESQRVVAVARMSDGSFLSGEASVLLTLAACIDGG